MHGKSKTSTLIPGDAIENIWNKYNKLLYVNTAAIY